MKKLFLPAVLSILFPVLTAAQNNAFNFQAGSLVPRPKPAPTIPLNSNTWRTPQCEKISDVPLVFTTDDGKTLKGSPELKNSNLENLTPLRAPNTFLAIHNDALMISTDAGCTWQEVEKKFNRNITAAGNDEAYIWQSGGACLDFNRMSWIAVFQKNKLVGIPEPVKCLSALIVDASNPQHLRAAGSYPRNSAGAVPLPPPPSPVLPLPDGWEKFEKFDKRAIVDSTDGGKTWKVTARYPVTDIPARMFINPYNPDQMMLSSSFKNGSVSLDGGKSWQETNVEVSQAFFSPADKNIVWVFGLKESPAGNDTAPPSTNNGLPRIVSAEEKTVSTGRAGQKQSKAALTQTQTAGQKIRRSYVLYISKDGGRTFSPELIYDRLKEFLPTVLAPHPTNSEIVYFADKNILYKYNWRTRRLSSGADETNANPEARRIPHLINDIVFSPANPSLIYLALQKFGREE